MISLDPNGIVWRLGKPQTRKVSRAKVKVHRELKAGSRDFKFDSSSFNGDRVIQQSVRKGLERKT